MSNLQASSGDHNALSVRRLLSLGLQHVMIMYAGTITVPLIIASVMNLNSQQTIVLVNASLLTSGLATLLQSVGVGRFGARLPLIQGCSFVVLAPMALIGQQYGLPTVFGSAIAAGLFTLGFAPIFSQLIRFFPPLVIGCVITIIGISLIPAAAIWLGGGNPGASDFAAPKYLLVGGITLILTLGLYCKSRGVLRNLSTLLGMIAGTLVAIPLGMTHFGAVAEASWLGISTPFSFGLPHFSLTPVLVACLSMVIVMTETTGNVLLIDRLMGQKTTPARLADTLRADGLSTIVGGCLNSFPYNAFSQNAGLLMLTRVYNRKVLTIAGIILIVLGAFPKIGAVVATIPRPVLGGVGILMFGMTLVAGIQELCRAGCDKEKNALIIATSVSIGTLPMAFPGLFNGLPPSVKLLLDSGIFIGGFTAVLLNALINGSAKQDDTGTEKSGSNRI